jgi:hypothetical protein
MIMTRKTSEPARRAALAAHLKQMFRSLSARPVPDRIRSVVDQLDDGEVSAPPKTERQKRS